MGCRASKTDRGLSREDLTELMSRTTYSEETIGAWYQVFTKYSGGGNVIKVEDLLNMCSKYDRRPERLGSFFCERENGEVAFAEFLTAQYVSTHGTQTEKLARLFRLCDTNRDGFISSQDFRRVASSWGQNTETEVQQRIFLKDNRAISENEFIRKCEAMISDSVLDL